MRAFIGIDKQYVPTYFSTILDILIDGPWQIKRSLNLAVSCDRKFGYIWVFALWVGFSPYNINQKIMLIPKISSQGGKKKPIEKRKRSNQVKYFDLILMLIIWAQVNQVIFQQPLQALLLFLSTYNTCIYLYARVYICTIFMQHF